MCLRGDKSCSPEHVIVKDISNILVPVGVLLNILNIHVKLVLF